MKSFSALLFFFAFCQALTAQNLAFRDLTFAVSKSTWEPVDNFLSAKGWVYYESSKEDDENYGKIVWSFRKEDYNDKAIGWVYLYTYEDRPAKISFQVFNKPAFDAMRSGMIAAGMKPMGSSIEDDYIINKYANALFIATVSTSKRKNESYLEGSSTTYTVTVIRSGSVFDSYNGIKKGEFDDGSIYEASLKGGELNGPMKVFYADGTIKLTHNMTNGKKNGISKEYDENGTITGEFTYANDILNGPYKMYEEGRLVETGTYINDQKSGLFKAYNEKGQVYCQGLLKNGEKNGSFTYFYYDDTDSLAAKESGQFIADEKQGSWTLYTINKGKSKPTSFETYSAGTLNGPFKQLTGDSIVLGTYKDGNLNGSYLLYRAYFLQSAFVIGGDTSRAFLTEKGFYDNGVKSGLWSEYTFFGSRTEGAYANGSKTGIWKEYLGSFDFTNDSAKRKGQLFRVGQYKDDQKTGLWTQYGYIIRNEVPCKTQSDTVSNDTCYEFSYHDVVLKEHYENGLLHGSYSMFNNALNKEIERGQYDQGEQTGIWMTPQFIDTLALFGHGTYESGSKQGLWKYLTANGEVNKEVVYQDYNIIEYKEFHKDGSIGPHVKRIQNDLPSGNKYLVVHRINIPKKQARIRYEAEVWSNLTYDDGFTFDPSELMWSGTENPEVFRQGTFREYRNDSLHTERVYERGLLHGTHKRFLPGQNVQIISNYRLGEVESEFFYTYNQESPFSGIVKLYGAGNDLYEEIHVQDGKRHGTTKQYKDEGEVKKESTYSEGVLQ